MTTVGVRLQTMGQKDQCLVLARIAESRAGGNFVSGDVSALFLALAIPVPGNVSSVLGRLQTTGHLMRPQQGCWRLTPIGRLTSDQLLDAEDTASLLAESVGGTNSTLGTLIHPVVPPTLAPPAASAAIAGFLKDHPFDTNIFGMTRFPGDVEGDGSEHLSSALETARTVCAEHGMMFHLASDGALADDLWGNILTYMWACKFGIAFFEARSDRGLNYNMSIEVGAMLMSGRRCALLRDQSVDSMPTDLVGHIYKPVSLDRTASVEEALHEWLRTDLRLGSCGSCRA